MGSYSPVASKAVSGKLGFVPPKIHSPQLSSHNEIRSLLKSSTNSGRRLAGTEPLGICRTLTSQCSQPASPSITSPIWTSVEGFAILPLTLMRPASQSCFAKVRRLTRPVNCKNLSSLMVCLHRCGFGCGVASPGKTPIAHKMPPRRCCRNFSSRQRYFSCPSAV